MRRPDIRKMPFATWNRHCGAGYPDERGALHALLAGQLRKLGREQQAKTAADEAIKLANAFQEHAQPDNDHQ